ncbi:MAG TPA: flagellar filament capping protein FliD [Novimethylophilus sp.]|jgi:flagellar hook-associated protein 2|uniref:flagellar filament capping protein FliD n=1 Tax=Novimethylophilus sp. TaxID=2137426 RepID=UPI002F3F69F9
MALSSPGIGSNLDVNAIVSQLMQLEKQPVTLLNAKEAAYQARLTAYGTLKGALSSFQSSVRGLLDASQFMGLKATPADATIASASASSTAVAGNYAINITKLAQSQKLIAAGQASSTSAIGAGTSTTLTFDFGTISGGTFSAYVPATGAGGTYTGATFASSGSGIKTVTINSTNNSLAGIRDAINSAGIGVRASIINDGGASPYRLVLSAEKSGSASSLKISVSGDATISTLLAHDPAATQRLQETVTAQNTEMTVDGVFVSKASTSITDVISGVTLNALAVGTTKISVARDTSSVQSAVQNFVKAYNTVSKNLKDSSAYNADTKQAAILQGEFTVQSIQRQLRSVLNTALPGGGALTTLSQLGVSFQKDGTLALDSVKLQKAMDNNFADIAGVFAAIGKASDSLISYVDSTSATKAGIYAVNITQLATQGKVVGSAAAGLTITAGVNDALSVTVNGVTAAITLSANTYTAATLATEVQSKINGASAFSGAGISVAVTQSAGTFSITSNGYGSTSNVTVFGNGATNLLGAIPTSTVGLDVAGKINGVTASGSGQYLKGAVGDASEGLRLLVTGGALGSRGNVNFSRGYADQLDKLLSKVLDSKGILNNRTDGISRSIKDIGSRRDVLNRRLVDVEARYRKQFTALDTLMSRMTQTSSFLTQQLASLPKLS